MKIVSAGPSNDIWEFELFVNDETRRSVVARENIAGFCEKYLKGRSHIKVIDLMKHPEQGFKNNICVTPTLIKRCPSPVRTMVGDFSDTRKVQYYLGIDVHVQMKPEKKPYSDGLKKQGLSSRGRHKIVQ